MKVYRYWIVIFVLVITSITSACNGNNEAKNEKVELVEIQLQVAYKEKKYMSVYDQLVLDSIDNFNKLYSNIKVVIKYMPDIQNGGIHDNITILESNDPPDIILLSSRTGELHMAAEKGLLQDLIPLSQTYGSKEIDIVPAVLDTVTYNNKLLILPAFADVQIVLFNRELFKRANIDYPQEEWTWEQFEDTAKLLNAKYGATLGYNLYDLERLMMSYGQSILSPNGETSVGYLDSPYAVKALTWLKEYNSKATKSAEPDDALLERGMSIRTYVEYLRKKDMWEEKIGVGHIGAAPLPHIEGGKRAVRILTSGYGISHKSEHSQEAWKFIEYLTLTEHENIARIIEHENTSGGIGHYFLTTSRSLTEATGQSMDPIASVAFDELKYSVKSFYDHPFFWKMDLRQHFNDLKTADDKDLPDKLHELALEFDLKLKELKAEYGAHQRAESESP